MTFQAKVIYDFEAVGEGELTVRAGDIVTITNTNVGQGWLYGVGVDGREGIVPEGYLEKIQDAMFSPPSQQMSKNDLWDDDWDSDDEDKQEEASSTPILVRKFKQDSESSNGSRPTSDDTLHQGKVGKFSHPFGKSDKFSDYLLGMTETATVGKNVIFITEPSNGYFQWEVHGEPFTCLIGTPKKSSKFGGIKTFIAYQVTPSFSNIQVSRRYKHFDWLHERLVKKFGMIITIPPLPEKQVTGRFEEDLIEHRRVQLQSFTDRICRHPVLSTSEVWKHFLSETDDKKWTQGKRKVEGDANVGVSLLTTIQAPSINLETEKEVDDKIVNFSKDMTKMESAVKNMKSIANDQINRYRNIHNKEYKEVGKAFAQLGAAMQEEAPCLSNIGACYQEMSDMWDKQVAKDWEPLQHLMHDYKGITAGWHAVLGMYANMKEKKKEIQRSEGLEKEKEVAVARINTHRVGVEAERTFFKQELGVDMAQTSQMFLVEQINFHRQISDRLEKLYYECWPGVAGEEQFRKASQTSLPSNNDQGLTEWD